MEPLISIVIPIYKVEKYIRKCVDSVRRQTYSNIEIVLVDDGSPDMCPIICDELAEQDSRIKVIHKANGGLSDARNVGIGASKGDYIGFVDSDDYIDCQMYEMLYKAISSGEFEMAICNYSLRNEQGEILEDIRESPICTEELSSTDALYKLDMFKANYWYYVTAVNKLYKRELFDKVMFPVGKIHEDEYTVHYFFDNCTSIISIDNILYYYIRHDGSIMTSSFSEKKLDILGALWDRYKFFERKNLFSLAFPTLIGLYGLVINYMKQEGTIQYYKKIQYWIHQTARELLKKRNLRYFKLEIVNIAFWFKYIFHRCGL